MPQAQTEKLNKSGYFQRVNTENICFNFIERINYTQPADNIIV